MSRHRAEGRPRYGRIATLGVSLGVTLVAVLGGTGLIPQAPVAEADGAPAPRVLLESASTAPKATVTKKRETSDAPASTPRRTDSSSDAPSSSPSEEPARDPAVRERARVTVPGGSGEGRRVVFSEELQRVWLVRADESVQRTYLVSGSVEDNLDPGTYAVYSRSEHAIGIDDSGTMDWFVRFTQGDRAAIGFHDIPVLAGAPVQPLSDLGTPTSHGCIRQKESDAKALWAFAPLGTTVVVV